MVDQIKMLKEIQGICKSLLVASRGYNQESPTMEGGKQWIRHYRNSLQQFIISTLGRSCRLRVQQFLDRVVDIFAKPKGLPSPQSMITSFLFKKVV